MPFTVFYLTYNSREMKEASTDKALRHIACWDRRADRQVIRKFFSPYLKLKRMKNIQVIDGAVNSVYDIFQATDEEFALIYPPGEDVAFIDEVYERGPGVELSAAFERIWTRRIPKRDAMGIHGLLFFELDVKMKYYPTRRDEAAINPDGSLLR
jgi:hypothetical protein